MLRRAILPVLALALAQGGCGVVAYDDLYPGAFSGTLLVMWVDEGSDTEGDGRFVFVPVPSDPLTFRREAPNATLPVIVPQRMYTDGGSVPRIAQPLKGLSPWGYAPAYMVHDWLFRAKNCVNDQMADAEEAKVAPMPFIESAEVLGEAIKTLIAENRVSPDDVAPELISSAVAGPISRAAWEQTGACEDPRISGEHNAQVDRALGQYGARGVRALGQDATGDVAGIVSVVQF